MISIALATYNGEQFLREQLDSIYAQTYKQIEVVVTDDCSTDNTISILEEYEKEYSLKYYINDKRLGFVKNFERAISLCNYDYIALSDQDDVWLPNKLDTLLQTMIKCEQSFPRTPIIIHHDVFIVDKDLRHRGLKYFYNKGYKSGLKNLLFGNPKVQGAASMFNRQLRDICFPLPDNVPLHDLYISFVCECFGMRKYVSEPLMLYRQHGNNQVGVAKFSFYDRLHRFLTSKVILADSNEIKTISILKNEFKNKFCKRDLLIIDDYFEILGNNIAIYKKVWKVLKNRFNSDLSVIKLILKIFGTYALKHQY